MSKESTDSLFVEEAVCCENVAQKTGMEILERGLHYRVII
jgi:hypothetical protein